MRIRPALIRGAAALSVSACATADGAYGPGYAYGYDSPYAFNRYNGLYGYGGYGNDNCGWYGGFFYPGFGNFVFDRHHHRHQMSGRQHDYFTRQARGPDGGRRVGLGSSGGVVPPSVSQPQPMPQNRGAGARGAFGGRGSGGFGGMRHH
jgi:hypothetical protein